MSVKPGAGGVVRVRSPGTGVDSPGSDVWRRSGGSPGRGSEDPEVWESFELLRERRKFLDSLDSYDLDDCIDALGEEEIRDEKRRRFLRGLRRLVVDPAVIGVSAAFGVSLGYVLFDAATSLATSPLRFLLGPLASLVLPDAGQGRGGAASLSRSTGLTHRY